MKKTAKEDPAVRAAIWATICRAAEQLPSCTVYVPSLNKAKPQRISAGITPNVKTWRLVEALSLLGILLRADSVQTNAVTLFATNGPLEFVEDGEPRFLWVQKGVDGDYSGLVGRPDLFITWSPDPPTARNTVRIVEVKFVRSLGAADLRAEYGKAYDLLVQSYFIWTYYTPRPDVLAGARGLRIDLQPLGFDTVMREQLLNDPDALLSMVTCALEESRKAQRFAVGVERAAEDMRQKRLGPAG